MDISRDLADRIERILVFKTYATLSRLSSSPGDPFLASTFSREGLVAFRLGLDPLLSWFNGIKRLSEKNLLDALQVDFWRDVAQWEVPR